jgi:uncharacterized membrane protein
VLNSPFLTPKIPSAKTKSSSVAPRELPMLRQHLLKTAPRKSTSFRWRGDQVSRLEGLSDAVFGFAITLLVVSLEVPRTFDDLAVAMRGFGGFAVCFCLLSFVWYDHYIFFRMYGLQDTLTGVLNLVLLFLVMFYTYPLKFLFTLLVNLAMGVQPLAGPRPVIRGDQFPALLIIFGAGFVAVYVVFTLMYLNAYRQRRVLELTRLEEFDTRAQIYSCLILVTIGLTSIALACVGTPVFTGASGTMYWMIGPAMGIYWTISGRQRKRMEAEGGEAAK